MTMAIESKTDRVMVAMLIDRWGFALAGVELGTETDAEEVGEAEARAFPVRMSVVAGREGGIGDTSIVNP
jgi:hypothetical protein